jgi:hypothetical protein
MGQQDRVDMPLRQAVAPSIAQPTTERPKKKKKEEKEEKEQTFQPDYAPVYTLMKLESILKCR